VIWLPARFLRRALTLKENGAMALETLRSAKTRSFLTMLGVSSAS
jgi:hypothetical protein